MNELVSKCRALALDHEPDGWPAIQMRDVSALCDAVESVVPGMDRLEDRLASGCEIRKQFDRWYLFDAGGDSVVSGGTIRELVINLVFTDC